MDEKILLNLRDEHGAIFGDDLIGNATKAAAKVLIKHWLATPEQDRDLNQMDGDMELVSQRIKIWVNAVKKELLPPATSTIQEQLSNLLAIAHDDSIKKEVRESLLSIESALFLFLVGLQRPHFQIATHASGLTCQNRERTPKSGLIIPLMA